MGWARRSRRAQIGHWSGRTRPWPAQPSWGFCPPTNTQASPSASPARSRPRWSPPKPPPAPPHTCTPTAARSTRTPRSPQREECPRSHPHPRRREPTLLVLLHDRSFLLRPGRPSFLLRPGRLRRSQRLPPAACAPCWKLPPRPPPTLDLPKLPLVPAVGRAAGSRRRRCPWPQTPLPQPWRRCWLGRLHRPQGPLRERR
mmetsp:Transcript_29637/g.95748  ORF Transcript_29637/g.95748 Transcript_29637/m.95748 type:complete len:200 (+) Transcript_29637:717-1316(+)